MLYAALEAIREENPAEPIWQMLLKLAGDVKSLRQTDSLARQNRAIARSGGLVDHRWRYARASARKAIPAAVQAAVDFLMKTAEELATGPQPNDREGFAARYLPKSGGIASGENPSPIWAKAMQWHCDLLSKSTQRQFQENIKKGNAAANAKR